MDNREPPALLWSLSTKVGPATQFTAHAGAYFVRMLQAHRGRGWRPVRVVYAMPEPPAPSRYRAGLGCPVLFNAPVNAIEIARADLRAEKPDADPHLHALLSTYAGYLLRQELPGSQDLERLVRASVQDGLLGGRTDLAFVARRLGTSGRSIQRALACLDLSFRDLRDEERLGHACKLLREGRFPIGEIAASLGYAETAAFSRAFRRQFGISPSSYRGCPSSNALGQRGR